MDQNSNGENLTEVFVGMDPTQVQIARDVLEGGGIQTFLFDGVTSRLWGAVAIPMRLMVHADDADEAIEQLKELGFTD